MVGVEVPPAGCSSRGRSQRYPVRMSQLATRKSTSTARAVGRSAGTGGKRLSDAFEIVSRLPAHVEARRRLVHEVEGGSASTTEIADVIESDAGLAIAVMRAANNGKGPPGRVAGVSEAVASLSPQGVEKLTARVPTYDQLDGAGSATHERFRRHGVAVRHAADRVAEAARLGQRDELAVAALLHDVGRLVLVELYGDEYGPTATTETPEERIRRERREIGIDHALVGAVLVRRWGLRGSIATAIERHHSADAEGHAAAIGLADAIVHHAAGDRIAPDSLLSAAERLDLGSEHVRALLYEFPHTGGTRRRSSEPCPLSEREIDALRGLAEGKVYKQIAQELSLSVSTIRTHLHNVYRKIGAVDRAQAVLLARDRGWI
jgi:putative nucleotidyltransferase with HDIG domain